MCNTCVRTCAADSPSSRGKSLEMSCFSCFSSASFPQKVSAEAEIIRHGHHGTLVPFVASFAPSSKARSPDRSFLLLLVRHLLLEAMHLFLVASH